MTMFFVTLNHNVRNRVTKRRFNHSTQTIHHYCHAPIPDPTRMADPNRVRVRDYTVLQGLTDLFFFFFKAELVPVIVQTIYVITKIIFTDKRTTTGVVSFKIYTHILSPIYYYKHLYLYMSNTKNIRDRGSSAVSTYL